LRLGAPLLVALLLVFLLRLNTSPLVYHLNTKLTNHLCRYSTNPFLGGLAKKQLDAGVSNSIFDSLKQLSEGACRQYPQLAKKRDKLEWGYRLIANDLNDEQRKMNGIVPEKRETGFIANLKTLF